MKALADALAVLAVLALPAAAHAAEHVVRIEGMAFQPATLTVQRGDRVVWVNRDVVPHTATAPASAPRPAFDSGQIAPGARWSWTAPGPGRFDYVCTFHPGMKATVVVAE